MPSKPRSLAGILHRRRAADAEYNRARRSGPDRSVEDEVVSSARWKDLRARVLRDEHVCRACAAAGRTELATQVDHVVPVRVRPDLAYDLGNCQPLCGATSISHASAAYGGAWGTSRFSRVSGISSNRPGSPEFPGFGVHTFGVTS
jgi:hypothetical protein